MLEPTAVEPFDLGVTMRGSHELKRVQVKTIIERSRNGIDYYVIRGMRNNGVPYSLDEADFMVGVVGGKVYLAENREISEYWARKDRAGELWRELKIGGDAE